MSEIKSRGHRAREIFSCGRFLPVMLRVFPPAFYACLPREQVVFGRTGRKILPARSKTTCSCSLACASMRGGRTRADPAVDCAHHAATYATLNEVVRYPGGGWGIGARRAPRCS